MNDHPASLGPLQQAWGETATAPALRRLLRPSAEALPVPSAEDRATWAAGAGRAHQPTLTDLLGRANADLGQDWPQVPARGYVRYVREGDRIEHESRIAARQQRLSRAAVAAAVTLEPHWFDEVADGVITLCEQTSWCWPAHDDAHARHGHVLPDVDDPFLDLGAGEVAAQLAWVDHLLGTRLDVHVPGLRRRIRSEVQRRVFDPFRRRRDWHWLGLDGHVHNWNPWIHQNVLTAAAALLDDDGARAAVFELAIAGLDRYVAALPADGAIDEGFDYWWNGACRTLEALAIVRAATGDQLTGSRIDPLPAVVAFPYATYLGGDYSYSFSDCQPRLGEQLPWHLLHRWAREVEDGASARFALSRRPVTGPLTSEKEGLGRLLLAITDPDWTQAPDPGPVRPATHYLPSTQVLVAHEGDLTLAIKGGHNDENHNHNDVGSLSVALRGCPVLVDPGRLTYTAQTFGPDRYELWNVRSDWHNLPTVAGHRQAPGAAARAEGVTVDVAARRFAAEIGSAYPQAATRWHREAHLAAGAVEVTDSWRSPAGAPAHQLHWILAGEVTLAEGAATVRTEDGALRLRWDPTLVCAHLEERELDDPYQTAAWGERLTRLTLTVREAHVATGSITLRVEQ